MNLSVIATVTAIAAALIVSPATAYADPVPTPDEAVAVMAKLTDPGIPAVNKGDVVTPGLAPDEAGTADDHLKHLNGKGYMPFNLVVTDIQPAPGNTTGATVAAPNTFPHSSIHPVPIALISQSGHWSITHDAAMAFLNEMWRNTRDHAFFK